MNKKRVKFLSPYWEAAEIGFEKGHQIFRPQSFISADLTNQPNISVLPLANSENLAEPDPTPVRTNLDLLPSATREEILQQLSTASVPQNQIFQNTIESLAAELRTQTMLHTHDCARFREFKTENPELFAAIQNPKPSFF